jgi:hypothetical protein
VFERVANMEKSLRGEVQFDVCSPEVLDAASLDEEGTRGGQPKALNV